MQSGDACRTTSPSPSRSRALRNGLPGGALRGVQEQAAGAGRQVVLVTNGKIYRRVADPQATSHCSAQARPTPALRGSRAARAPAATDAGEPQYRIVYPGQPVPEGWSGHGAAAAQQQRIAFSETALLHHAARCPSCRTPCAPAPKNTLSRALGAACRASAPRPMVRPRSGVREEYGVDRARRSGRWTSIPPSPSSSPAAQAGLAPDRAGERLP